MGNCFGKSVAQQQMEDMQQMVRDQDAKIRQLTQELSHYKRLQAIRSPRLVPASKSPISREKILEWVDKQLDDPANNIGFIPDKIERQLKSQIFLTVLNMLDYILETTKIEMMGHQISFDMSAHD